MSVTSRDCAFVIESSTPSAVKDCIITNNSIKLPYACEGRPLKKSICNRKAGMYVRYSVGHKIDGGPVGLLATWPGHGRMVSWSVNVGGLQAAVSWWP